MPAGRWRRSQHHKLADEAIAGVTGLSNLPGIHLNGLAGMLAKLLLDALGHVHDVDAAVQCATIPPVEHDNPAVFPRAPNAALGREEQKNHADDCWHGLQE